MEPIPLPLSELSQGSYAAFARSRIWTHGPRTLYPLCHHATFKTWCISTFAYALSVLDLVAIKSIWHVKYYTSVCGLRIICRQLGPYTKTKSQYYGSKCMCVWFQSEISEMSSVIADKLEFLEVTRAGLSKLQLLLVQLEVKAHWAC